MLSTRHRLTGVNVNTFVLSKLVCELHFEMSVEDVGRELLYNNLTGFGTYISYAKQDGSRSSTLGDGTFGCLEFEPRLGVFFDSFFELESFEAVFVFLGRASFFAFSFGALSVF